MANRKLSLISTEVAQLMIKQIAHELKNRNLYLSFANYFSVEGITDLEEYYRKRAEEENNHHQWLMDYLSEADVKFMYPAVETIRLTAVADVANQSNPLLMLVLYGLQPILWAIWFIASATAIVAVSR